MLITITSCAVFNNIKVNNPMERAMSSECAAILKREPSYAEERTLGSSLALSYGQNGGFLGVKSGEQPGAQALAEMGIHLSGFSARPDIQWVFSFIDNPQANAFSAPGGFVMITRGMLNTVENQTQLAALVAHEIAHVTLRHALHVYRTAKAPVCEAQKQSQSLKSGVGKVIRKGTDAAIEELLDPTIDAIVSKGFAQSDEYEADLVATDLLVMAGYNPHEFSKVLAKFPKEKSALKSMFANHPDPDKRIAEIEKHLKESWPGMDFSKTPSIPLDSRIAALRVEPAAIPPKK
jgi:beta-barrel assembly-enhancing protease